jgi:hypothetical protein
MVIMLLHRKLLKGLTVASSHKLLGLADNQQIKDSDIIVDKIFTISRLGAPIIRLEVVQNGVLFASAINGPSSVKKPSTSTDD